MPRRSTSLPCQRKGYCLPHEQRPCLKRPPNARQLRRVEAPNSARMLQVLPEAMNWRWNGTPWPSVDQPPCTDSEEPIATLVPMLSFHAQRLSKAQGWSRPEL